MPVEVYSNGLLDAQMVSGDLAGLLNQLNIAAAKGWQFVMMEDLEGRPVAFETRNIAKMKEVDEDAVQRW